MEKKTLSAEENEKLLNAIVPIVLERGPSRTTMDLVAQQLGISKRTLYEIFESKDLMLRQVMTHFFLSYKGEIEKIMRQASNVMEALANFLVFHRKVMLDNISVEFFRDMDKTHKDLRNHYDDKARDWSRYMVTAIRLGMRQRVFRSDLNPVMVTQLLRVQMEAMKRMEEVFPPEITLGEAYSQIGLMCLRGMATEKGMKILDSLYDNNTDF